MLAYIFLLLSLLMVSGAMESGIVGGKEVKKHSRPYMVSVQYSGKHICGGTLIREDFVLTAAHCLNTILTSDAGLNVMEVVLGAHNIAQKREKGQQRIQVLKSISHPNYKKYTNEGVWRNLTVDIMLLKLKSRAKLDKFVKVLPLPNKKDKTKVSVKCTIAGWGMRKPHGVASDVLYEASVKVLPMDECKQKWQDYFFSNCMLCTATTKKNAFCQGDSGGPLICSTKLQGMAIYTYSGMCNNPDYPQVHLNIISFLDWIKNVMGKKM